MKKARNELLQFLAGLAMLIAGLFILYTAVKQAYIKVYRIFIAM